jgi:hypothetical protein
VKKSTKAVLLSAFVFPGAGHILLKKYIPGAILIGASLVAFYYLISKTVERTLEITEKIQNGDVRLDVGAIAELVSKQPTGTDAQLLNIATIILIVCWLVGVFDT